MEAAIRATFALSCRRGLIALGISVSSGTKAICRPGRNYRDIRRRCGGRSLAAGRLPRRGGNPYAT